MNRRRDYHLLLTGQFLGAFGDNFFLWLIIGPLTYQQETGRITAQQLGVANALYTCLLYAPYVLLAPLAGYLNDRYSKTRWLLGGNLIKVLGALVAMLSLTGAAWSQGVGYFIIGIGACIFSPAKYGILPELLPQERLVKANGTVEFLTILAILSGMLGGALAVDNLSPLTCHFCVLGIYAFSALLCALMRPTPFNTAVRLRESTREFFQHTRTLFASPRMARVLLGCGLFWASGSMLKMNFQPWGLKVLGLKSNSEISALSLWLAIGVVAGSILAGQLHKVGDLRITRRYGWMMALLILLLFPVAGDTSRILVIITLVLAGTAAGLYLIPLNAALQAESNPHRLGKTIATQNLVDNLAMVAGGAFVLLLLKLGSGPALLFLAQAVAIALFATLLQPPAKTTEPA
jgi:LPLT family lysophospholipid transporter-like MFS transporter